MPVSYLDIAGTYVGPGAYNYNTAAYPGGAALFVNSATGLDNRGRVTFSGTPSQSAAQPISAQGPYGDPNKPLATVFGVNGALSFCKAGRGDVIIVAPGHTEVLNSGATITIPSGVTVIGGGYGALRPTFQFTVLSTQIVGGGAGIQLQNLIFDLTGVASLTRGFFITTGGFQFISCKIIQATATNSATDAIVIQGGGDDFLFNASEVDAEGGAGTRAISNPSGNTINRLTIINSFFHGSWSTAILSFQSTADQGINIEFNTFRQSNAAKTVWLFPAGNTFLAVFSNNDLFSTSAALHTDFISGAVGTGVGFIQNFGSAGAAGMTNKSGILIPDAGTIP